MRIFWCRSTIIYIVYQQSMDAATYNIAVTVFIFLPSVVYSIPHRMLRMAAAFVGITNPNFFVSISSASSATSNSSRQSSKKNFCIMLNRIIYQRLYNLSSLYTSNWMRFIYEKLKKKQKKTKTKTKKKHYFINLIIFSILADDELNFFPFSYVLYIGKRSAVYEASIPTTKKKLVSTWHE